jgi:hypothetical protein
LLFNRYELNLAPYLLCLGLHSYAHPERLLFFSIHLYDKEATAPTADRGGRGGSGGEAPFEFYPGSGAADDTARNVINVPLRPLWRQAQPLGSSGGGSGSGPGGGVSSGHGTRGSSRSSSRRTDTLSGSSEDGLGAAGLGGGGLGSGGGGAARTGGATSGRIAFRSAITARLLPALRAFNPSLVTTSHEQQQFNQVPGRAATTTQSANMLLRPRPPCLGAIFACGGP